MWLKGGSICDARQKGTKKREQYNKTFQNLRRVEGKLHGTGMIPLPQGNKFLPLHRQISRAVDKNYFQAFEIYFRSLEIYFSASEIYFRATEKVLCHAGGNLCLFREGNVSPSSRRNSDVLHSKSEQRDSHTLIYLKNTLAYCCRTNL